MKGLHKKIGVGVLVSGLLIGGVSFSSGSVSYASSKNNDSSGFVDFGNLLSGLGIEIPEILKIFSKDGFIGMLYDDYQKSKLPSLVAQISDVHRRELYRSVVGLGSRGKYSVIGFKLGGKKHSINDEYHKYWENSKIVRVGYDRFFKAVRKRFEKKGVDLFESLGLKSGYIYRVLIDKRNEFLIAVFDEDGM